MNPDRFAQRRQEAAAALPALELDALAFTSPANVRYLTGFTGSNGLLVLSRSGARFFTDPRYTIQAGQQVSCPVTIAKGPLEKALIQAVKKQRIRRLGMESARLTVDLSSLLHKELSLRALRPVSGVAERLRMIKDPGEIEAIRRSVNVNSRAFDRVMRKIMPGVRESDLAAELDYQMRRFGAESSAFETIVAAGERSALPHARPERRAVGSSGLLLIDMGALLDGYMSDMTRVIHLGPPSQRARELHEAVLESQLAAIAAVKPGVTAGKVDAAARAVLKQRGLEAAFVHSTGHGLGLEIHEGPRIGRKDKTVLEAGMVITIEPGAYLEGFGGVRIEDTVLVTATGCEVLTPTRKELFVV